MAESAVARGTVFALRREIARIEGRLAERLEAERPLDASAKASLVLRRNGMVSLELLETGAAAFDAALGGGIPLAALTEIHTLQTRNAGIAAGFALALVSILSKEKTLPVLWIGTSEIFREAGLPYWPGLMNDFGISADQFLVTQAQQLVDALWVAEEAARLGALGCVIVELRGNPQKLDLTATRRLHRRAQEAGRPVLLVREGAKAEPTAAPVRLMVRPAPAGKRRILSGLLEGSIGPPGFAVTLSKTRQGLPAEFMLEWNADERALHERRTKRQRAPDRSAVVSLPADRSDFSAEDGKIVALEDRRTPGDRAA